MKKIGVAIDLGTSGFRGQSIDLSNGAVLKTVITARHPLPGANVMDHLNFAIEAGTGLAHQIITATVNQIVNLITPPGGKIERLAVCGNPIQLSLFENIEIRDLAYAGERYKEKMGIESPDRGAKEHRAEVLPSLNLPSSCRIFIPPAVKHEIGADALAMMVFSGILERNEPALAIDYGTNAEMALKVNDKIITGSAAAGPALEGQHIAYGMLASPGAISDLNPEEGAHRCLVLNNEMQPDKGDLIAFENARVLKSSPLKALGITGTGVVAAISRGISTGLIKLPHINTESKCLHLGNHISFSQKDLMEAGKAIGALRAGFITLAVEAGIGVEDIKVAFMAGASGTYVDALKALHVGMVPPQVDEICQVGNTSLMLAREIVREPQRLAYLDKIASEIRASHCMFALSKVFEKAYLLELSYWTEGMPWELFQKFADRYRLPRLQPINYNVNIVKKVARDISDVGEGGLTTIDRVGEERCWLVPGCIACGECVGECPENALRLDDDLGIIMRMDYCSGTACHRCERICPEKVFHLSEYWMESESLTD